MLAAAGVLAVPIGASAAASAAASSHTKTYTTPGSYSFKVPANVANITVTAVGAAGGACFPGGGFGLGGEGALVTATVKVKPSSTLVVGVGGVGGACTELPLVKSGANARWAAHVRSRPNATTPSAGAGGTEGGGAGGTGFFGVSPGGGGASGVGGTSLGAGGGALVVAGGGGGAAFCGANGGNAGAPGQSGEGDGCNNVQDTTFATGGGAGTKSGGGAGGAPNTSTALAGAAGTAATGGAGGNGDPSSPSGGGGGGGAGYYGGGGGGGSGSDNGDSGAGGGGSSFTAKHAADVSAAAPTAATASVTITYKAQPKPKAVTHKATGVKSTSATIHGSVNPEGLKTTYYFQYGTTTKYGKKTGKRSLKAAGKFSSVKALLTGLKPSTKYHFRVVASNASGKADGKDMTFTTPSVAPAFTG